MTFYNQNFNVLGKVDGSRTVVTPDQVYFRMKEATFYNDSDYHRIKTYGAPTTHTTITTTTIPILPTTVTTTTLPTPVLTKAELDAIEREKDRQFQMLFNTLWPNIHSKLEDKTTAQKLAAEEAKNKALSDILLQQEIDKINQKKKEEEAKKLLAATATCCSSICTATCHAPQCPDAVNIAINGLTSAKGPQVAITMPKTTASFTTHTKDVHHHLPHCHTWSHSVSSYDLPNKLSCCPSDHHQHHHHHHHVSSSLTCKELLEARERECQKNKLEKTNHLVDSLVGEVKSLQTDLRRKSVELKMKEIEMAKKEAEMKKKASEENLTCCHRRRLSVSFKDDCPSSPRVSVSRSCSSCHLHKSGSSESLTDSSDYRRPSPCRKAKVKSILRVRSRSPSAGHTTSSVSSSDEKHYHHHHHPRRSHSPSSYILPKVDCWNRNVVDHKVY